MQETSESFVVDGVFIIHYFKYMVFFVVVLSDLLTSFLTRFSSSTHRPFLDMMCSRRKNVKVLDLLPTQSGNTKLGLIQLLKRSDIFLRVPWHDRLADSRVLL